MWGCCDASVKTVVNRISQCCDAAAAGNAEKQHKWSLINLVVQIDPRSVCLVRQQLYLLCIAIQSFHVLVYEFYFFCSSNSRLYFIHPSKYMYTHNIYLCTHMHLLCSNMHHIYVLYIYVARNIYAYGSDAINSKHITYMLDAGCCIGEAWAGGGDEGGVGRGDFVMLCYAPIH